MHLGCNLLGIVLISLKVQLFSLYSHVQNNRSCSSSWWQLEVWVCLRWTWSKATKHYCSTPKSKNVASIPDIIGSSRWKSVIIPMHFGRHSPKFYLLSHLHIPGQLLCEVAVRFTLLKNKQNGFKDSDTTTDVWGKGVSESLKITYETDESKPCWIILIHHLDVVNGWKPMDGKLDW